MSNDNKLKFRELSNAHIANFNKTLKNIKSEVLANFVQSNKIEIVIVTNKVAFSLDLQMIKKYVKDTNYINIKNIEVSCLLQLKLYLKIISILYILENTNTSILADVVETIIKKNHIFNNILIVSRPQIIKVLLKSNMAIIWLNI